MNDYSHISPSLLLSSYLEGDLNLEQEPHLFDILASSSDLRTEMRDLLQIRSLVHTDSEELTPPAILRQKVFATVGLPIAPPISVVGPSGEAWYLNRTLISIVSAAAGAILALLVIGRSTEFTPISTASRAVSTRTEQSGAGGAIPEGRNDARSRSDVGTSGIRSSPGSPQSVAPSDRATRARGIVLVEEPALPLPSVERVPMLRGEADTTDRMLDRDVIRSVRSIEPADLGVIPSRAESAEGSESFALSVTGFNSRSFPAVVQRSQSDPVFSNMSVGISRAITNDLRIGLEVGQEAFSQEYMGVENARGVRFRQNPLLPWAGLSGRLTPGSLQMSSNLFPFGEILLGATSLGPLCRAVGGVEYRPDSRVRFSLGVEGGVLAYRYMNNIFFTQKVGVNYGVSLSF